MMEIITILKDYLNILVLPILGIFLFYSSKKRAEAAKAAKEESAAQAADAAVRSGYAGEWKELYERKEIKVEQLEGRLDTLENKLEEKRSEIRDLKEQIFKKDLNIQRLQYEIEIVRCDIQDCSKRKPPRKLLIDINRIGNDDNT